MSSRRNTIARVGGEVVRPAGDVEAATSNLPTTEARRPRTSCCTCASIRRSTRCASSRKIRADDRRRHRRSRHARRVRHAAADVSARTFVRRTPTAARFASEPACTRASWVKRRWVMLLRRVDSHPTFDAATSQLELGKRRGALGVPIQLADVDAVIVNTGTDVAHNVRLRRPRIPEARLETVDGATREKIVARFRRNSSGHRERKGSVGIALAAQPRQRVSRDRRRRAHRRRDATGSAAAAGPSRPPPSPDFSVGTFRSEPIDVIDVGETVEWVLHVRNGGDGPARRVLYIHRSTRNAYLRPELHHRQRRPRSATSAALAPFANARGIVLNDVDPAVEGDDPLERRRAQRIAGRRSGSFASRTYDTTASATTKSFRAN